MDEGAGQRVAHVIGGWRGVGVLTRPGTAGCTIQPRQSSADSFVSASQPGTSDSGSVVRHLRRQRQDVHSQHINDIQVERGRGSHIGKVLHQYSVKDLHVPQAAASQTHVAATMG